MKRRIWTCLEWVLINKPDIMRDRHLDQVIMCVLYVVCKVSPPSLEEQAPTLAQVTGKGHERTFTDIMKHYRSQPQATSHIYRSVLLAGGREAAASPPTPSPHPPPTPGRMAASSTVAEDGEERGDLIKFYNAVFLPLVQDYAMRFKKSSSGSTGSMPPLSPLPQLRANPSSPRRKVSEAHSVFTRPLRPSNGAPALHNHTSPVKPLSYSFSRSPAKVRVQILFVESRTDLFLPRTSLQLTRWLPLRARGGPRWRRRGRECPSGCWWTRRARRRRRPRCWWWRAAW